MTGPPITIQPKLVYGLRSDIKGNIHFMENQEVIYPVAGVIAIHDFKLHKQTFLRLAVNHVPKVIAISPNRKLLAISEWNELKKTCIINTYDLGSLKKKRSIKLPNEVPNKDVSFMRFTEDSRGLAILSKEPDAFLSIFYFDKSETVIVGRVSNGNQPMLTADVIACNISDTGLVAVAGKFLFKLMSRQDKSFGVIGTMTGEHKIITSLVWLTAETLVAGTSTDQLLFIEGGDAKQNYTASTVHLLDLEKAKETDGDQSHLKLNPVSSGTYETDVNCLTNFERGFCYAQFNRLFVFEKEKSYVRYTRRSIIKIPIELYSADSYKITNVSVNAQMDSVIVTTFHSQIYISKLFDPENVKLQHLDFVMLGEPIHIASIISMSICSWKPIIMTASKDFTVRIWNYDINKVELVKKYQYDITALALHPSGLFVAIGFSDRLHLMEILLDTMKTVKEFDFPNCGEVVFSHQGHLLACAYGSLITIVSVFSFTILGSLRGHNGKVLSMSWSIDDTFLVSSGSEGAIYQWCVTTRKRINESVEKGTEFRSLALTQDTSIYVCTNTGVFREIHNSDIIRDIEPNPGTPLTKIALARSDMMLFVGTETGNLYNIQVPFLEAGGGTCTKYRFFSNAISCMKITFDDRLLVAGSEDGTLIIWVILNTEGKTAPVDVDHGKCSDVIVPRHDLIEKIGRIEMLETRLNQEVTEHSFELEHSKKMQSIELQKKSEKYEQTIKKLTEERRALESKYYEERNIIQSAIEEKDSEHSTAIIQLEAKLNEKMLIELDKSNDLKVKMENLKAEYEKLLAKAANSLEETIETMGASFKGEMNKRQDQMQQLVDEIEMKKEEFFHYCNQLNLDNDRRVAQINLNYETRLKESNDNLLKWRTETSILTKKNESTTTVCNQLRTDITLLIDEFGKNKKYICQLEQNISELQIEIDIRNKTLCDKEVCLMESLEKNATMEKMKQFLNERAIELETQIKPLDEEIKRSTCKINEIEDLKKKLLWKIDDLNIEIQLLRNRCKAIAIDLKAEKIKNIHTQTIIKRILADICYMMEHIQDFPKLKEMAVQLFKRHVSSKQIQITTIPNTLEIKDGVANTKNEHNEHTAMRPSHKPKKVAKQSNIEEKDEMVEQFDRRKLIKENLFLLSEIDKLKQTNGSLIQRIYYLESIKKAPVKKI